MSYLDTFTSPRIKTSLIFVQSSGNYTITPSNPSSARALTLADPGGSDTFAYLAATQTLTNKTLTTATLGNALAAGSFKITGLADPTSAQDAATKNYVDSLVQGIEVHTAVQYSTIAALSPANTYSGGVLTATSNAALSVDGTAVTAGQRILVKNEATAANNGIYVVTTAGTGSVPYVLTRASDFNTTALVNLATFVFVSAGGTLAGTGWVSTANAITLGSGSISFNQFTGAGSYTAGNGISITSNVVAVVAANSTISVTGSGVAVSATYPGNTSLVTLGTVTTGTWTGTSIAVANGGTGSTSASGARTNLSAAPNSAGYYLTGTNGELSSGVVLSQSTGILLSSGAISIDNTVVATLTNTQTLTNKTLTSPVINQAQIYENIITKSASYTASVSEDQYQVTTGSSAIVATVPQAISGNKGKVWTFTKVDSGTGTIAITPTTSTINGAASLLIDAQWDSISIVSDGTNYNAI
jgi:hypothetical protein